MKKKLRLKISLNFLLVSMLICIADNVIAETSQTGKISIYSVNYPLKYFSETIAGEYAKVEMPMPNDIDPAFWQPDALSILGFQQADLIILNGAGYAQWLSKVSLPQAAMVDTSADYEDEFIQIENAATHKHGSGGEHAHKGTAFTTWLDFSMASRQAKTIFSALAKRYADQQPFFHDNYEKLNIQLQNLDSELMKITQNKQDIHLLGSHPVYQYLKKRYKLNLKSVHWEPEDFPSVEQWQKFSRLLIDHPAKWMLWEAMPASQTLEKLEQMGIQSIVFNPCSNVPAEGDFISVMQKNLENIKKIFL